MNNPYEFDNAQQYIPAMRGPGPWLGWPFNRQLWPGYRLEFCDANDIRRLDMTRVGGLGESPFRPEIANDRIPMISPQVPWTGNDTHAAGNPIQAAHPTRTVPCREQHPDYPSREFQIPAPRTGYLWVEGNPWPAWRSAAASNADLHARIIGEDGSSWEMIGVVPNHSPWGLDSITCSHLARYDADGNLHPGDRHVVRGPVQASSLLLGRAEPMHRLGLVIRGDDNIPETLGEIGQWVALDPTKVPWETLTPDMHRVANCLTTFGAITFDHGGHTGLGFVSGADWQGVNWGTWRPTLAEFHHVLRAA